MASKAQTVMENFKAALEANYATTVYPPDLVVPVLFWPSEAELDASLETVYFVRPGRITGGPGPESCTVTEHMEVFILATHRYESPSENPLHEDPARWSISTDLAADVSEKLREDEKLGGEALTVFEGPGGLQAVAEHERYVPKWVCPEMRTVIRYRYEKDSR